MNAETRSRIFDPFFTTKFTGRGLGLACRPRDRPGPRQGRPYAPFRPDSGTTFKVLFPCTGRAPSAEAPARTRSRRMEGPRPDFGRRRRGDRAPGRGEDPRAPGLRGGTRLPTASRPSNVFPPRPQPFRPRDHGPHHALNIDGKQALAELRALSGDVRVVLMSGFNREEAFSQGVDGGGHLLRPETL